MGRNEEIFNNDTSLNSLLNNEPRNTYERNMRDIRQGYVREYGFGKDVLDLGCGIGTYLVPYLNRFRSAVGVDYSNRMLETLRQHMGGVLPENLEIFQDNAELLGSVVDDSVDFVYSYSALYYVENIRAALAQVRRVLRCGGIGVIELGNRRSLNNFICEVQHAQNSWARIYCIDYEEMQCVLDEMGFEIVEHRCFQLLPMLWLPKRYFWLYPLITPLWRPVLGRKVNGKMLDEHLSGSPQLRRFAFRHLFVIRKR